MNDATETSLAPPGAGIPSIERLIGGMLLALHRRRRSREQLTADFGREREIIASLYRGRTHSLLRSRVLIPRLKGLEDSSRHWSVLMTLDHLRIVNDQIGLVIGSLSREVVPSGKASTAAVKPRPDIGPEAIAEYESSCDRFVSVIATCGDLRSRARYAHPWFGPLDAASWQAMATGHMKIHRNQIARILLKHAENTREVGDQT